MKTSVYILILLAACAIITAAHYAWHATRTFYPDLVIPVYLISWAILLAQGYVVLGSIMRKSYTEHGRLTHLSVFLAATAWGLLFAFPAVYSPHDWAWSWSHDVTVSEPMEWTSRVLVFGGLAGVIGSMAWLGFPRTMGQDPSVLRTTGPYRYSRNPQLASSIMLFLGYSILRPSWFAVGWLFLIILYTSWMIDAEEEHLEKLFGEHYTRYRQSTPRIFGLPAAGRTD